MKRPGVVSGGLNGECQMVRTVVKMYVDARHAGLKSAQRGTIAVPAGSRLLSGSAVMRGIRQGIRVMVRGGARIMLVAGMLCGGSAVSAQPAAERDDGVQSSQGAMEIYTVRGTSMEPLISEGTEVVIVAAGPGLPRESVVVARIGGTRVIKSLKGVPGDRLALERNEDGSFLILVNGVAARNSERRPYTIGAHGSRMLSLYIDGYGGVIPDAAYLLLGDNPAGTRDSTQFGLVDRSDILGTVVDSASTLDMSHMLVNSTPTASDGVTTKGYVDAQLGGFVIRSIQHINFYLAGDGTGGFTPYTAYPPLTTTLTNTSKAAVYHQGSYGPYEYVTINNTTSLRLDVADRRYGARYSFVVVEYK